jgi:hypothetical protein
MFPRPFAIFHCGACFVMLCSALRLLSLSGLMSLLIAPSWAQNLPTGQPPVKPPEVTPLPPTTTQEAQVNRTGLSEPPPYGWNPRFIGSWRGDFDLSIGLKLWTNQFAFRNLNLSGTVDVAPGVRLRGQIRRREGETQFFVPEADEAYLEIFNHYRAPQFNADYSVKFGRTRYLHFPYPDAIAQFDLPTSIQDFAGGGVTDYRDIVLQSELAWHSGLGLHAGALAVLWGGRPRLNLLEAYGFYRRDFGRGWHFESRAGLLQVRQLPYGRDGELGGVAYLGKQIGEFNVGLLYEAKRNEQVYTGIMIQFRPGPVTRALGKVTFDYSRQPEGFTFQFPIWHGRLNQSRFVRSGDILVGEVRAIRIRTVFPQGVPRNQYEHRLASWGENSDPRLRCVVEEEPWYLQTEALISPNLPTDSNWEKERQGPGQYVQRVTYRFYRPLQRRDGS